MFCQSHVCLYGCYVDIDFEYPGDVSGIIPSAILTVLPRLLSAAAPPGNVAQENRRQCLKASENVLSFIVIV